MKTKLLLKLLFSLLIFNSYTSFSQVCGEQFTDSGGLNGTYANGENITTTICPEISGEVVSVSFLSFDTESCCDSLTIYDGDNVAGTVLGVFVGNEIPPFITSTHISGCLTFVFHSDGSIVGDGWVANIFCSETPICAIPSNLIVSDITSESATIIWNENNTPPANSWELEIVLSGAVPTGTGFVVNSNNYTFTNLLPYKFYDVYIRSLCDDGENSFWSIPRSFRTLNASFFCGDLFTDSGGINEDYTNNEYSVYTICPEIEGEVVSVNFSAFSLANGDIVTVYNGDSDNAPLLTSFTSTNIPSIVTSTLETGCLTFVFDSNASATSSGWVAQVNCLECQLPTNLTAENLTPNTTKLSWLDSNLYNLNWEIEIVLSGENPEDTGLQNLPNPYIARELLPDTQYDYYVRAMCGTDVSWIGPHTFRTLPIINVPYNTNRIPYKLYSTDIPFSFVNDDVFSYPVNFAFDFKFFGTFYNELLISSNGFLTFNLENANAYSDWNLSDGNLLPSQLIYDNSIFGVYQDLDNSIISETGSVSIGLVGTAPFRKFVTTYFEVPLFNESSCPNFTATSQMSLYESYNFIDVQIRDRNSCELWNNGFGILGIQNIGGQEAYFPENRNTGNWEAHNEGWRFRPELDHPEFQYILCDTDANGYEIFDLNIVIEHFDNGSGNQYTLFESLEDAENNTNFIFIFDFGISTFNSKIIYLRDYDGTTVVIKKVLLATIDCNADYDLDNVPTSEEDLNNNGNYGDDDTDGDLIPDFIDEDDDGDYVLTNVEAISFRNPEDGYLDTDGDLTPDYLDNDDDGDGILTLDEDINGNYILTDDDSDGDNIPDYLDHNFLSVQDNILNSFALYPNPVKNIVTLELTNLQTNLSFTIYNLSGSVLYKREAIQNLKTEINISNFSAGVYFIKLENDNHNAIRKFVKE